MAVCPKEHGRGVSEGREWTLAFGGFDLSVWE